MFSSTQNAAPTALETDPCMSFVVIAALVMPQAELARVLPILLQLRDRPPLRVAAPANSTQQQRLFNEMNRFNQQRRAAQEPTHAQRSQQKSFSQHR